VSSVSSLDYDSSSSDDEEERFSLRTPSLTMIYGKSMCGKTTFVMDLLAGEYFNPLPVQFYMLIPKPATEVVSDNKIKEFVTIVNDVYSPYNKPNGKIVVVQDENGSGIAEICEKIQGENKDIPKLLFIDDLLSDKMLKGLFKISNEVMHHSNACVLITSQMSYLKDAKPLRENCNYIVLFPGLPDLTRFFSGYHTDVVKTISSMLSQQRDEEFDTDGLECPKPIIIDKEPNRKYDVIRIWRDVTDISPTELNLRKFSQTTDSSVRKFVVGGR
jgi:hypothetical protein